MNCANCGAEIQPDEANEIPTYHGMICLCDDCKRRLDEIFNSWEDDSDD